MTCEHGGLDLLCEVLDAHPDNGHIARLVCLAIVAVTPADASSQNVIWKAVRQSGVLQRLHAAKAAFPEQQQLQQFVPALALRYSIDHTDSGYGSGQVSAEVE
jgi:cytochrome c-type biogenesis protein CcmH/NrfG